MVATELNSDDRRDSVRMMSHENLGVTARLKIGSKTVPVEILDASAGGYLIEIAGSPRAKVEQPVELITASGRHLLRVVWQRQVEQKTSMGLQRLHEELPWRQDSSWVIWMLVAVILGLAIGAYFALGDQVQLGSSFVSPRVFLHRAIGHEQAQALLGGAKSLLLLS